MHYYIITAMSVMFATALVVPNKTEPVEDVKPVIVSGSSEGRPQLIKEKITVTEEKKENVQTIVSEKKVVKIKPSLTKTSGKVVSHGTDKTAMSEAKNIIKKYEGVRLQAYRDHGQRSIGYGTKSYQGEVITLEEAIKRNHQAVDWRLKKVITDYPELGPNQHAALVSYFYNCPSVYAMMKKNGITEKLRKSCVTSKGTVLRGLVKRRADEWNLFNQ